ncbi:MAG: hypothetical protein GY855_13950, partial [candidate division Zixibacteria bacterium]|nr:hypothetical protein [candidate division Zixibacteria bacterium]
IWSPSYLVNIENPKNARITLKATLTNEVGNLENSDVTFVVGYPNFLFSDIKSPMTLDESIEEFLRAVEAGGGRRESYGQANITRQVHARGGFESAQLPPLDYGYASAKGTPGQFEEDLFFYRKDDVNLNEEERAYYQLFSDLVPYSHIYEWEIPDVTDKKQSYNPNEKEEEVPVVWHSIKLKNSTDYPWTTAPAFTVKGIDPLAQDVIKYTPKGSEAILRLTLATDVKAYGSEKETNRQKRMRRFNSYDWDLVTIKGKLKVKNFKSEKITISIKKYITGEVLEASYNATIEKTVEDLTYNNIKSVLSWELPVDPKNELNISYTYQVFVR